MTIEKQNEQTYYKIEQAVCAICRLNDIPNKLANGVASVFYDGIRIANGLGFDWIEGEGYHDSFYGAAIKGMKHTLYAESRAHDVREFFDRLFGTSKEL